MNRTGFILVLVSFLCLGLVASNSYAAGTTGKEKLMTFNNNDLIGVSVRDSHGEYLGIVNGVMIDSGGHAFAIINHGDYDLYGDGGVNTPVPFEALQFSQTKSGKDHIVFKMDTEHLDFAPYLDPAKSFDRQREANIYEYYGIQPYWTENGMSPK